VKTAWWWSYNRWFWRSTSVWGTDTPPIAKKNVYLLSLCFAAIALSMQRFLDTCSFVSSSVAGLNVSFLIVISVKVCILLCWIGHLLEQVLLAQVSCEPHPYVLCSYCNYYDFWMNMGVVWYGKPIHDWRVGSFSKLKLQQSSCSYCWCKLVQSVFIRVNVGRSVLWRLWLHRIIRLHFTNARRARYALWGQKLHSSIFAITLSNRIVFW